MKLLFTCFRDAMSHIVRNPLAESPARQVRNDRSRSPAELLSLAGRGVHPGSLTLEEEGALRRHVGCRVERFRADMQHALERNDIRRASKLQHRLLTNWASRTW